MGTKKPSSVSRAAANSGSATYMVPQSANGPASAKSSTTGQQLSLPLTDLPTPPFIEDRVQSSDQRITKLNAHLRRLGNPFRVYEQLLIEGANTAKYPSRCLFPQCGYQTLAIKLQKRCGIRIDKKSVRRALDLLMYLGYVQRTREAEKGKYAAVYAVLTPRGIVEMFRNAGVRYFRLIREKNKRKIQLIKPMN